MSSRSTDTPVEDLMRRSYELEQRVVQLQETLSNLRMEMEKALTDGAFRAPDQSRVAEAVPQPKRLRRSTLQPRASQETN